ncbi:hypothetical protein LTR15_012957 [Elasticomyces elasticus]|nr:hypothetical protein LTR15_012957 [Elasticomyces elasticus]
MAEVDIRLATPLEVENAAFVESITKLINESYLETEETLYKPGKRRTGPEEVKTWLLSNQLYLAFDVAATGKDYPIGSIRLHDVAPGIGDLGILTVHHTQRGSGLGLRLIKFGEGCVSSKGLSTMQLELLVPKLPRTHEFKQYLRRWYEKLGYVLVRSATVEEVCPQMKDSFNGEVEFLVMQKSLI